MKPHDNVSLPGAVHGWIRLYVLFLLHHILILPSTCSGLNGFPGRQEDFLTVIDHVTVFVAIDELAAWAERPPVAHLPHPALCCNLAYALLQTQPVKLL